MQASGRALRPFAGKECGYIMLPLIVPEGVDFDEFTDTTPFKAVARIISALSTQDEGIAEEFRNTTSGMENGIERKIIFEGTVPVGMKLDLNIFAEKINAKIWERVAKLNFRSFIEARAFVHTLNFNSSREWQVYCSFEKKPSGIPVAPNLSYQGKGWLNWGDWLGTYYVYNKDFLPFNEARDFVQKLNFKNRKSWKKYCSSREKPNNIPSSPGTSYKDEGWLGMGDFLGTGKKAYAERTYRSFEEARAFVHTLNIKTYPEWRLFAKSKEMPKDIPNSPLYYYKDTGWKGCGDWLGTGSVYRGIKGNRLYLPFEEARAFVHTLNIQNMENWNNYSQSEDKPLNIPPKPQSYYKDKGWSNWDDWLGIYTD